MPSGDLTVRIDGEIVAYVYVGSRAVLFRGRRLNRGQNPTLKRQAGRKWTTEYVTLREWLSDAGLSDTGHADIISRLTGDDDWETVTIRDEYRY